MKVLCKFSKPLDISADICFGYDEASEYEKNYYSLNCKNEFLIYENEENSYYGCIRLNRSIVIPLEGITHVSLGVLKPAKGSGSIEVCLKNNTRGYTLFSSRYSEQALEWFKNKKAKISNSLGLAVLIEDYGYDA